MSSDELNFDLTPQTFPVTLTLNGQERRYVLKEASAGDIALFKNQALASARVKDGVVQSLGNVADQEPLLVSLCLYEADAAGNPSKARVNVGVVKTWPARVTSALFQKARDMSGLGGEDDNPAQIRKRIGELQEKLARLGGDDSAEKKPQGPTTDTSDSPENSEPSSTT